MTQRIGVLGGSFDPIHLGHLLIAEEARRALQLDTVVFVPAGVQWMKEGIDVAPAAARLDMTRLAIEGNDGFQVSDVEVIRPGPSYTVETIEVLRAGAWREAEVFFILGQDALAGVGDWKRPEDLIRLCQLAVMPRVDAPPIDLAKLGGVVQGMADRVTVLGEAPRLEISSSALRRRLGRRESVRYLVPDAVVDYIVRTGLYRTATTALPTS